MNARPIKDGSQPSSGAVHKRAYLHYLWQMHRSRGPCLWIAYKLLSTLTAFVERCGSFHQGRNILVNIDTDVSSQINNPLPTRRCTGPNSNVDIQTPFFRCIQSCPRCCCRRGSGNKKPEPLKSSQFGIHCVSKRQRFVQRRVRINCMVDCEKTFNREGFWGKYSCS